MTPIRAPAGGAVSGEGAAVYSAQTRITSEGGDAYAAYYAAMDKSMQQKVALTTAFFPVHGVLADMGCGSGQGSFDLSQLHVGLRVIGVDVEPRSIDYARTRYVEQAAGRNLSYQLGDIADALFPD